MRLDQPGIDLGLPGIELGFMGDSGLAFGAQSVPGFQVLNEHIAERSLENNDFYKISGELVGDTASNFLMYGAASSATIPFVGVPTRSLT